MLVASLRLLLAQPTCVQTDFRSPCLTSTITCCIHQATSSLTIVSTYITSQPFTIHLPPRTLDDPPLLPPHDMSPSFSPCKIHDAAVAGISSRVRQFHESGSPFRIYHGSTNSTRKSSRRHDNVVDISRLNLVLSIGKKTAIVEPNVPMDKLVEETLKRGLIPPVVMEFPG